MPVSIKRSISSLAALGIGLAVAVTLFAILWLFGLLLGALGMDIHWMH